MRKRTGSCSLCSSPISAKGLCRKHYREDWRSKNMASHKESCRAQKLKQFGMTVKQYEDMLAAQGGGCAICGAAPGKKRLAVDHCHATGKVRGLLCAFCNVSLGNMKDSVELLRRAIGYLEKK